MNVDGVYGPETENQVKAFKEEFGIPGESLRVTAPLWNSIASVYDDLYIGGAIQEGQFPGYNIS